ncbi:unnamed protein product [Durusdinium trenchii]|uniref:Uncharacterized protein n=1 Tax=Durusdinium trenchii TaxID=1381693 RepID=A0ABP0IJQ3_9DINO
MGAPSRRAWVLLALPLVHFSPRCFLSQVSGRWPRSTYAAPATSTVMKASELPEFDLNSVVDRTEMQLCDTTLKLVSSVFGFPDYESLLTLNSNGTARFYAGMVSKELGAWSVIEGDPNEGEDPSDLYLEWTQPLTDAYKEAFTVPGGTAFWRGKLNFRTTKSKKQKVFVEGGIIVSEREEGAFNMVNWQRRPNARPARPLHEPSPHRRLRPAASRLLRGSLARVARA